MKRRGVTALGVLIAGLCGCTPLGPHSAAKTNIVTAQPSAAPALPQRSEANTERAAYIEKVLHPTLPPEVADRIEESMGTGFFVADRVILTNRHVVANCKVLTAESGDPDSSPTPTTLLAADPQLDLAVLSSRTDAPGIAQFEGRLERADGSDLSILGFPSHGLSTVEPSIVPVAARPAELSPDHPLMRFSADVHPGHSGSPVVDEYGAVIGVVRMKVDTVTTYQKTGSVVTDIGFAIPNRSVLAFLKKNHIAFQSAEPRQSLAPEARLDASRAYLVRVGCWN